MKIAIITCDVLTDEVRHFAAQFPQVVHVEVMEQGLHTVPDLLRLRLQETVLRLEANPEIDAIAFGYGLCSRGTEGVHSRRCRLVIPRAHDCITLLLGCRHRYASYVAENPGTYWYSPGWNRCHCSPGKERVDRLRAEYVEKYGEEDADYLMEMEQDWLRAYSQATFVDIGVTDVEADLRFTKECADWLGWKFDAQKGDSQLFRDLVSGNWDADRFLVLNPGETAAFAVDESVIKAVPCAECVLCPKVADGTVTQTDEAAARDAAAARNALGAYDKLSKSARG